MCMYCLQPGADGPIAHRPYDWDTVVNANTEGTKIEGLLDQTYNRQLDRYEFSGRQDTDAVLIGSKYTVSNLTFSFPTQGKFYDDQGYPNNSEPDKLVVFNDMQQDAARYAFNLISSYTNLTFTEITETNNTHANIRMSQTNDFSVGSAYGNFPSASLQAGDIWFGRTNQPFYLTPQPGNWGQATIMHEIGHTMGLKHGQDDYSDLDLTGYIDGNKNGDPRYGSVALTADHDGQDWSLMTYRSDPDNFISFEGEGFNQPQTYMQNDIAALQFMYGANFNTQGGNTVYTWNDQTGVMSIDGVAQATPTSNKISMTLWDGNGIDTYNLSNYTTDLAIDLRPGEFSTFSEEQLVNHRAYSGGKALAEGNVANALLYQDDLRSLIENATGGTGDDRMLGNQVANTLSGGAGDDALSGGAGADILIGGGGNDRMRGGAGADTFFFTGKSGADTIVGAGRGDLIRIDVNGVDDFSDLTVKSDGNGGALVSWKNGSVDLLGIAPSRVTESAFVFGPLPTDAPAATAFVRDLTVFQPADHGHLLSDLSNLNVMLV